MWRLYYSVQQKFVRYYSLFSRNVWKKTNGDRNYLKQHISVEFLLFRSRFSSSDCPTSFGNRAICQWDEEQSVSNTDVVCATSCSTETKHSSMHALLTLVLGRGLKQFTLSGWCESQSTPGGRSNFCLWIRTTQTPPKHNPQY